MKTKNDRFDGPGLEPLGTIRARIETEFSDLIQAQPRLLRLALNEAEAIAWQSGFPELFFPGLAFEKAEGVRAWHQRQTSMLRPQPILSFAA